MSSFVRGTPKAVMDRVNKRIYGNPPSTGGSKPVVNPNVGIKSVGIPGHNAPIRGVGTNDGGPKPRPSTGGPRQVGIQKQMQFMSDQLRGGSTMSGTKTGLGAAMSGTKTGLGTAMGMKKMAGAGAALGKSLGMKSGGKASSASKRADGIAVKGKTKGKMMSKGGKAC